MYQPRLCVCRFCGKEYKYERMRNSTRTCASCSVNRRRFLKKKRGVEYLGGKCSQCGYNKSVYALDFHHIDPATKSFNISGSHGRKWETIQAELDKCIILCANCHREHFDPDLRA